MRRILAAALALTPIVSSCMFTTPPGAHMSPPVAVDDFCTRLAQTTCDGFDHCCDDESIRMSAPSHDTCVTSVLAHCTVGDITISHAIHDPVTGYDPAWAGAVIGQMRDYVDRCDPSVMVWSIRRDGFDAALRGTVPPGGQCLNGDPAMNYPALLSCEDLSQSCIISGGFGRTTVGNCNDRRTATSSCLLDFDCATGLYCAGIIGLGSTCQPTLADGGSCGNTDGSGTQHHAWCQSSFCFRGQCTTPTRTNVYCGGGAL